MLRLDGIQDAFQQQLTLLQLCTHLLTRRGLREFRSRGAHHPMFAHRRAHSSGSAQFRGILGERLFVPVSDEKNEAAEATAETRAVA